MVRREAAANCFSRLACSTVDNVIELDCSGLSGESLEIFQKSDYSPLVETSRVDGERISGHVE